MTPRPTPDQPTFDLGDGYRARPVERAEWDAAYAEREAAVFASMSYRAPEGGGPAVPALPEHCWLIEREQGGAWALAGWHRSRPWSSGGGSADTVYMVNTGLLPGHRGRGVYTRLLPLLAHFRALGYRRVRSHHHATNNAVLVPKLRAGFLLSGLEVDDHGLMAVLTYPYDDTERQALHVRSGLEYPAPETARRLGLNKTLKENDHAHPQ